MREDIIFALRELALSGQDICSMVNYIQRTLNLPLNEPFIPIMYFQKAFSLSINDAIGIGLWDRFRQGSYSLKEINDRFLPLIQSKKSQWDKKQHLDI